LLLGSFSLLFYLRIKVFLERAWGRTREPATF
jgi:hypothetical protein